jgi:3-methyladenine DNA glycosylase AlkD
VRAKRRTTDPAGRAQALLAALQRAADPQRALLLQRFFKTGPGEYGEGGRFLGLTVPQVRALTRPYHDLALPEALRLLQNPWHEVRLAALMILVAQFRGGNTAVRRRIYRAYLARISLIDNWDLVDSSAADIIGGWLLAHRSEIVVLRRLAADRSLWARRIAIIASFAFIRDGASAPTFALARTLLHDSHDLIHKAVGWMLREVGKRVDRRVLRGFLDRHAHDMPRTMLRYAIEHLPAAQRQHYLARRASRARD